MLFSFISKIRIRDFSALVSLVNKCSDTEDNWGDLAFQYWKLPSLQFLKDDAWVPPPSFADQLPSLVKYHSAPKLPDVASLLSFLNATQRLEELQLNILCESAYDSRLTRSALTMRPNLPALSLRKLQLTLPPAAWAHDGITVTEYLLRMFLCPGITELTLRLEGEKRFTTTDERISEIKRAFPLIRDLCPCLERLSLTIAMTAWREELYLIDDILQNLPSTVVHIDLSLGHINLWTYRDGLPVFPNRPIRA